MQTTTKTESQFKMNVFIFFFLTLVAQSSALELSKEYTHGPFPFDENAEVYFTIDLQSRTANLAVKVLDADVITSDNNWVGIGISEPTSGSMLGADVVTAEFDPGAEDECRFTDRYVPFAAYPLIESKGDSRGAFPDPDECQDDGSWTLVRCTRSEDDGEMILEVSRSLDAHDKQDRDIVPGLNNIIYAYGSFFAYHGSQRSSIRLFMYSEDGDESLVGTGVQELPDDIDGSILIQATNYTIPNEKVTTYTCTSHRIKLDKGEKKMIVAAEPVLKATDVNKVHHLTLFLCSSEEYAKLTENTVECTTADNGIDGPQGSQQSQCSTFIFAYAKGMKRLVLPREAGIVIDDQDYILVMETHYDNPDLTKGEVDESGVRIYYTETMRDNEAGSLLLGDSLVSLFGQTVKNDFEYEFTCPSECTSKFSRPINFYASFLHMHTTGKEIYNNRFDKNGTFIENLNKVNFWSDSFQQYVVFDNPKVIRPGDQMQVSCLYDTTKRPETKFGGETTDEMCMEFVSYWPVQRDPETGMRINICAYFPNPEEDSSGITVCGDNGNLDFRVGKSLLAVPNPKFEDSIGAPTDFGEKDTCKIEEVLSTGTPEPISTAPSTSAPSTTESESSDSTDEAVPLEESEEEDDPACFPSDATVVTTDGVKRMDELTIGDIVHVGKGRFSEVFMFTHHDKNALHRFVQLRTATGAVLTLTRGHYMYINGVLSCAEEARIGDVVELGSGELTHVKEVRQVWGQGLYNPQTVDGDVVVGGVRVSTYTKAVEWRTAHALLTPLRSAYMVSRMMASRLLAVS